MKVLQLVQKPQLRGAEVFTSQLSTHINRSGHNVSMVFLFPGSAELPFTESIFHLNGKIERRFSDIKAWRKLANIIAEEKPDIIQANAGDTLKYAVISKLLFRWEQPIVFRNASTISLYIKKRWVKKLNGFFFNYANKIISVCESSSIDFATLYPHYKNKISTIPIGIETNDSQTNSIDKILKNSSHAPVLIHVGGFTHEKNHLGLISIFEEILKTIPTSQLYLLGDGPLRSKIETVVKDKGLSQNVQFLGFQRNAIQYIKDADVLLLPSLIEGLPGVILEAFFCKTPVVAYDVGGIKEIVHHHTTGCLIPKGDEKGFAKEVVRTVFNAEQNIMQVNNAYKLVTTRFANSLIAQEFINLYTTVIKN